MYRLVSYTILVITTIVQCVDVKTVAPKRNSIVLLKDYTVTYFREYEVILNTVNLKPLRVHNSFLWRRLDSLKQWKRRRRMAYTLDNSLNETDKLKEIQRSSEKLSSLVPETNMTKIENQLSVITSFKKNWPVQLWREYGLFTDDYLLVVNPHWLHFAPPDRREHYALGTLYIAMLVIGCTGNALVLIMYIRCRTLRTAGNILVANLALSDFIMLAKTPIFIFNSFNLGPATGKTGCVIYGFLGGLTGTTSIATLSAIALDRYWAVVRPLEPLRALTAIRARLLAIAAWLYAGLFAMIPALDIGYGRYVPEGYLTSCSFDYLTEEFPARYFIFVFFCAAWVAPFFTISFCYISIFRVVVCSRNLMNQNQEQRLSSRHVKERTKRKAEIKLAFLVMAVIALFFISWTPYAVVALLGIFGEKELITPISSMIPALFCKTAACINPFIYIITHPTFRKEFKKLIYTEKAKREGTLKTIGYYTDTTKVHRPSKDFSDTDVEVVEMKDIPYKNENIYQKSEGKLRTISYKVSEREGSQKSVSMKSFEDNIVSPPSWYSKPQFVKKKSFHRRSTQSIVSQNTDPTL